MQDIAYLLVSKHPIALFCNNAVARGVKTTTMQRRAGKGEEGRDISRHCVIQKKSGYQARCLALRPSDDFLSNEERRDDRGD